MMRPNIEVMCIVKFQYATSAMLALLDDHFLVSLLFLDVPYIIGFTELCNWIENVTIKHIL